MKTYIVRTRIENNETTGARPIYLPAGFGTVKGALFYYATSNANLNALDSTTNDQTFGIGFAGSPLGGAGVTSRTMGIVIDANGAGNDSRTYAYNWSDRCAYSGLPNGSVSRQLRVTGFAQDRIDCDLTVTGTQTVPLDVTITVFAGAGLSVAVNSVSTVATAVGTTNARWINNITFRPDLILGIYNQNASPFTGVSSIGDAQICFGAALRSGGAGTTSARETCMSYRNQGGDGVSPIFMSSTVSDTSFGRGIRNANELRVTNYGGTGFSVFNFGAAAGGSYPVFFMAFYEYDPGQYDVEPLIYRSAIGTSFYSVGFIPQLIIGATSNTDSPFNTIDASTESDSISVYTGYAHQGKNNTGRGTITSSTGSTTISGTGTSFRGTVAKGDVIYNSSLTSLGTVAFVVSNTSLQLTANASATVSSGTWMYEQSPQYSISIIGDDNQDAAAGANLTTISTDMMRSYTATGSAATTTLSGKLTNFDSRPGFGVSYNSATYGAIARKGFFVAFDDTFNRGRRGTNNSQ
jgi:hypothetical protein